MCQCDWLGGCLDGWQDQMHWMDEMDWMLTGCLSLNGLNGWMQHWLLGQVAGWIQWIGCVEAWCLDEWMTEWMDEWQAGCLAGLNWWINGWLGVCQRGWLNEWMYWMDRVDG